MIRRAALLLLISAALSIGGAAAWAHWGATVTAGANGAAVAASVNAATTPTASLVAAQKVTLTWTAVTLSNGVPVDGYIVKRYNATTLVAQTVLAGCAGTITGTTCTESAVPAGSWRYAVYPLIGANWVGLESPMTTALTVIVPTLTLAKTYFGAPLPSTTTGTVTGFGVNEAISYRLDSSTTLTGFPTAVDTTGSAPISALTIPAGTTDGSHTVYVLGGNGSIVSTTIIVDTVAPTVGYSQSPTANGSGWNNSTPVTVTLTPADATSGVAMTKYTTDGTDPTVSGTAVTYSGPFSVASTKTVKYYAVDNAGNAAAVATQQVKIDTVAPTVGYSQSPTANGSGWNNSTPVTVTLTPADATSGVAMTKYTTDGTDPTVSGTAVTYTVPFAVAGTATVKYYAVDNAGNAAPVGTQLVKIDTVAPANAIVLSSVTGAKQSGSTIYYRGVATGSFTLTNTVTDASSGPASSSTAALGGTSTGFTHTASTVTTPSGGPYVSNAISWSASTTTAPTETVTGADVAGNTTATTLSLVNDSTAPSGGSVDATGLVGTGSRYSTSTAISVGFAKGTDSGVGLATSGALLQRATATLTTGTCGSYGGYSTIATDPTSPYADTVTDQACYRYQYVVADLLGNSTPYVSGDIKVDTTAPTAPSLTASALTNTYLTGTTLYYRAAATSGSVTLTAAATDPASGILSYSFPSFGTNWTSTPGSTGVNTYSWSGSPAAPGTPSFGATDNATLTSSSNLTLTNDSTGPSGGSVDATGLVGTGSRYSTSTAISVGFAKGTDSGVGLATSGALLQRATATLTTGTCGSYGGYSTIATDPTSPYADTVTDQACYRYQYVVADLLGNSTTYVSGDVKVDTTAPTAPSLTASALTNTYLTGTTLYYRAAATSGSVTLTASSTDPGSGILSYSFPSFGTNWTSTPGSTGVNTYSWSGSPAAPGSPAIVATDNANLTASTTLTVTNDSTAPTGSAPTYASGTLSSASVSVTIPAGADTGSGLATTAGLLQRRSAPMTAGVCGSYGAFGTIATGPSSPYADTTVANNNCYQYQFVYADNVGNTQTYASSTVVKAPKYYTCQAAVVADAPDEYYRMVETTGTAAADSSGNARNGTFTGSYTLGTVGACGTGTTLPGGAAGNIVTPTPFVNPTVYSLAVWFKTATAGGTTTGRLAGFGNAASGGSGSYDRHIYLSSNGKLNFGAATILVVLPIPTVLTSTATYNDAKWHYAVATQSAAGMKLYVDGALVASNTTTTSQNYTGYWRVGWDNMLNWGSQGNSDYFAGAVSNAAFWSTVELTPTQIYDEYAAGAVSSGALLTAPPDIQAAIQSTGKHRAGTSSAGTSSAGASSPAAPTSPVPPLVLPSTTAIPGELRRSVFSNSEPPPSLWESGPLPSF